MARAVCMTTAIRERMPRQPAPTSMTRMRGPHANSAGPLAGNPPHPIHPDLESDDLEGRADHLEKVFATLHVYLTAIVADTAQHLPGGGLDRRYLDNLFQDVAADALAVVRSGGEGMRGEQDWQG